MAFYTAAACSSSNKHESDATYDISHLAKDPLKPRMNHRTNDIISTRVGQKRQCVHHQKRGTCKVVSSSDTNDAPCNIAWTIVFLPPQLSFSYSLTVLFCCSYPRSFSLSIYFIRITCTTHTLLLIFLSLSANATRVCVVTLDIPFSFLLQSTHETKDCDTRTCSTFIDCIGSR